VRFKLPVVGAAYNFGEKFGATVALSADLLARVKEAGFVPSLTFHPGTQCTDPAAWQSYIEAAADISKIAGVKVARLNVGGGFPSHRQRDILPQLEATFALIDRVTSQAFGADSPELVCEPGRGLVGDAFTLAAGVKAVRDGKHVFLNDGLYGALMECHWVALVDRVAVFDAQGKRRFGPKAPRVVFGPTCDSVDQIPGEVLLAADISEGDYVFFESMGAYSWATNTEFNGFGGLVLAHVLMLDI
ncbi:MAG: type III PLP-dependent enzyme, partial [Paracoccaceae bacterium]